MIARTQMRNRFLLNYLVFGVLSALFSIFIFKALLILMPYQIANILALLGGKIFSFFTNKKYVFHSLAGGKQLLLEIWRYIVARGGTGLIDFFGLIFFVEVLGFDEFYSKIFLVACVVLLNFLLSWSFVFKTTYQIQTGSICLKKKKFYSSILTAPYFARIPCGN